MNSNGLILYQGPSMLGGSSEVVAIATGFKRPSKNNKTGDMIQVCFLVVDRSPLEALKDADVNFSICGKCPMQGVFNAIADKQEDRVCYVNIGQSMEQIYQCFIEGRYETYDRDQHDDLFLGRKIRWGSYGDPAAIPIPIMKHINKLVDGWTGYSHQLLSIRRRRADSLAKFLMCSCGDLLEYAEAQSRGYRAFLTVPAKFEGQIEDCIECPHYTHGVQCKDCRLCSGLESQAKNILVKAHGSWGIGNHQWDISIA